jgi:hypothetical protein
MSLQVARVAYQKRDSGLPSLKTDFLLDSLRTDLRLTELVKRVVSRNK